MKTHKGEIRPMTDDEIRTVLAKITFPGFRYELLLKDATRYLQIFCDEGRDTETGGPMAWSGRKWMLSVHMTTTELVQTAHKATYAAITHELDELFRYRGESIFNHHIDVDDLVDLRHLRELDSRPDARASLPKESKACPDCGDSGLVELFGEWPPPQFESCHCPIGRGVHI